MWNFQYKSEYEACVADLERSGAVQSMRFLPQHAEGVSTYDHASLVAYTSFRVCSVLGLDARAAARGGLLHDLFLYNWQDHSIHSFLDHMENHPRYALENAEALFALTDTERDIIATHLPPLGVPRGELHGQGLRRGRAAASLPPHHPRKKAGAACPRSPGGTRPAHLSSAQGRLIFFFACGSIPS